KHYYYTTRYQNLHVSLSLFFSGRTSVFGKTQNSAFPSQTHLSIMALCFFFGHEVKPGHEGQATAPAGSILNVTHVRSLFYRVDHYYDYYHYYCYYILKLHFLSLLLLSYTIP